MKKGQLNAVTLILALLAFFTLLALITVFNAALALIPTGTDAYSTTLFKLVLPMLALVLIAVLVMFILPRQNA